MKQLFLVLVFIITGYSFSSVSKKKVIFFGDSITELGVKPGGYITRVDSMFRSENRAEEFEFIGSGISGNKIYDLYLRLEEDVISRNPDVVVIYIGVNDVWHKTLLGTGTDPDKFEKFYEAILIKLKEKNIKVILCTPAVVGEKTDMSNPLDGDLNRYSNIIREIAKKNDIPLIDLRKKILDYLKNNNPGNLDKNVLTYDKVHMNAKGNQFIAEEMWRALK
ncbi:MAG: G-D-S-L family lipolytic protein [Chitinophagaceae bacterium]|nr:G-D-S-L family lipolytic protein [Chitinophagaceae bacterium]